MGRLPSNNFEDRLNRAFLSCSQATFELCQGVKPSRFKNGKITRRKLNRVFFSPGPTVSGSSIKRLSAMLQLPSSKQQVFPPAAPLKKEENNNEKRVFNEISNKSPSPM